MTESGRAINGLQGTSLFVPQTYKSCTGGSAIAIANSGTPWSSEMPSWQGAAQLALSGCNRDVPPWMGNPVLSSLIQVPQSGTPQSGNRSLPPLYQMIWSVISQESPMMIRTCVDPRLADIRDPVLVSHQTHGSHKSEILASIKSSTS